MRTRTLEARIERAEKAAKAEARFAIGCVCFPENEKPSFVFPVMEEMAIRVLCPIHGVRLQKSYQVYVSEWLRKSYQTFCGRTTVPNFEKPGLPRFPRPVAGRRGRNFRWTNFFGLRMGRAPGTRISSAAPNMNWSGGGKATMRRHDLKFVKEALEELDPAMKGCEDEPGYRTAIVLLAALELDQMWMHFHVSRGTRRILLEKLPAAQLRLDCGRTTMFVTTTGSPRMAR